jgi:hypothetical protein
MWAEAKVDDRDGGKDHRLGGGQRQRKTCEKAGFRPVS